MCVCVLLVQVEIRTLSLISLTNKPTFQVCTAQTASAQRHVALRLQQLGVRVVGQ